MPFQRRRITVALGFALASGAVVAAATSVTAADIKVEVTGSNIKRVEGEGALPVQTITREEIARSGAQTAFDVLNQLSAAMPFGAMNEVLSVGNTQRPGFAGVSLRGLGRDKTLVLLNGRRVVNYALERFASGVDLNSIPTSAIERIEILKDGASAIYGTDAIAGVINFITRKDFSGAELFAYYGQPKDPGGEQSRGTVTAGWGDLAKDKFNAWITADYLDSRGIIAADRPYAKNSYIPGLGLDGTAATALPANVTIPGVGTRNPSDPTPNGPNSVLSPVCLPPMSFPTSGTPHQCRYDGVGRNDMLSPSTKTSVIARLTWQFAPQAQLFGEATYNHNKVDFFANETPASSAAVADVAPLFVPASSPYYPLAWLQANYPSVVGQSLALNMRTVELGRRADEALSEQTRGVLGVKATLRSWDVEAAYIYNQSKVSDRYFGGWLDERVFWPLVNSGVVNPFGPNTPEVLAQMEKAKVNEVVQRATGSVQSLDFKAASEVAALPSGPLALAVGAEARREELAQRHSELFDAGYIVGGAGAIPAAGSNDRRVAAAFVELNIPVVKDVEVQAALRYDHYSDFGSTTNPKIALRWQPSRQALVRASWNKGFHAPSLIDLYQPLYITNGPSGYSDPLRCPVTQLATDCNRQFKVQTGGNPNLTPERSTQWSAGFVLEPAERVSASLDYFRIEIFDLLGQTSATTIGASMGDLGSPYVVRGPVDPLYPTLPGAIAYWVQPTRNLTHELVDGVDIDLNVRSPATALGGFGARINGTYIAHFKRSLDDGSFPNLAGTRADTNSIPRWRHALTFDWTYGAWSATLMENYTQSYAEPCLAGDATGCKTRQVGAYELWDVSAGYAGIKDATLRLGVKNVFDRGGPISNQTGTPFHLGYDPNLVDPRGRTIWGAVRYAFK